MTVRLYLDDSSLLRFDARVLGVTSVGEQRAVLLDRSAFYPEGGGQPGFDMQVAGALVFGEGNVILQHR